MPRQREFSTQTVSALTALCARPGEWHHGYHVSRVTGLKSGTLYPILIRLAERGLLESCWEEDQPAGRPRRHLYRLTSQGAARAKQELASAPTRVREQREPRTRVKPAVTG
jgi:PadR family transcriptional regulator PadR